MPLMRGNAPSVVDDNISEMVNAGHPEDQAVAAAYRMSGPRPPKVKAPKPLQMPKIKMAKLPSKKGLARPTLPAEHPFNLPHAPRN
jgi:hypothetical protein